MQRLVKTRGMLAAGARLLGRAGGVLLDLLYPPLCLCCDKPVAVADALCAECFRKIRPITAPLCPVLGIPFEVALGPDAVSAQAIADPPPFERARSAVLYNEVARAIVSRMKYGDRPELARFCARLMASAGRGVLGRAADPRARAAPPRAAGVAALQPVGGAGAGAGATDRRQRRHRAGRARAARRASRSGSRPMRGSAMSRARSWRSPSSRRSGGRPAGGDRR